MITLVTFPAGFGTRSLSPFCVKAEYLLNMAGADWRRKVEKDPRKGHHGKLPALQVGSDLIGDSDGIRKYLEAQGAQFEAGLSDIEKANARAFMRMAEEHMYFHLVLDRWANDAVWSIIRDVYFDEIPKLPRILITRYLRAQLVKGMSAQGLGRLTEAERLERLEPDLEAITARLWQGGFLFGERPCAADASVAAILSGMRATPVKTALVQRIAGDQILSDYIDRVDASLGESTAN